MESILLLGAAALAVGLAIWQRLEFNAERRQARGASEMIAKLMREQEEKERAEEKGEAQRQQERAQAIAQQAHVDAQALASGMDRLNQTLGQVNPSFCNDLMDRLGALPELIEGITLLIKSESEKVDALNRAIEILQASIAPDAAGSAGYELYATDTPAATRASEQQERADLIRRGIDAEEATRRVRERTIYDQMVKSRQ